MKKNMIFLFPFPYGLDINDWFQYFLHYIPESSFLSKLETFIWTETHYCKENNLLAVSGCYWAHPYSTEIYDFTDPEKLPFNLIFSSYELENIVSIDDDIDPLQWNIDGSITICCYDNKNNECQKTIYINKY